MKSSNTTQEFVPIKEVRDGVAIMKDGSMKSILMTSSLNFALKSVDEQESIIFQFQNFLNSLDFSIQIFIQSRKLDIRPYLNSLEQKRKDQINDLMRLQIKEYINFVRTFTESVNIMTKNFFIVVSYTPPTLDIKKTNSFFEKKDFKKAAIDKFEEDRSQLEQRVSVVKQGIARTGVRVAQLGTEELIEVYYKIFNPGDSEAPIIEN
ncbi:MAG TPA: TraC family protein [Candidatus Paceibacterota bacterium]|nr:TraC family protein [Candidatus Paceibacterota bacterium]